MKNRSLKIGASILLLLFLLLLVTTLATPYDRDAQDLTHRLNGPSWTHPFGRDELGRDILTRCCHGAWISLGVGVIVSLISSGIGLILGLIAGYCGKIAEEIIMRVCDILLAFPGLLLCIGFVAVTGPNLKNVVLALTFLGWVGYARLVRGQVLKVKSLDFVQAAHALGSSGGRIMTRHILPNIMNPVTVQITIGMAGIIITEASLSFLGLGVQPPVPSLGVMLSDGRLYLSQAPHLSIFPGLFIMVTVLGFNFLGDGFRERLDPKTAALPKH